MKNIIITLLIVLCVAIQVVVCTLDTDNVELPALPYDYAALEPYIDQKTMQVHHTGHHQAYTNNLNAALDTLRKTGNYIV
jgi:hypothetical protein